MFHVEHSLFFLWFSCLSLLSVGVLPGFEIPSLCLWDGVGAPCVWGWWEELSLKLLFLIGWDEWQRLGLLLEEASASWKRVRVFFCCGMGLELRPFEVKAEMPGRSWTWIGSTSCVHHSPLDSLWSRSWQLLRKTFLCWLFLWRRVEEYPWELLVGLRWSSDCSFTGRKQMSLFWKAEIWPESAPHLGFSFDIWAEIPCFQHSSS